MQNDQFFIWFPINLIKHFFLYFLYELLISLRRYKGILKEMTSWCFSIYNFV